MSLTAPLFLFLFLPLSLPLLPICPTRYRKLVLTLISLAFFVLANLAHPWSLLQIAAVVALVCLLSALPERFPARLRCAIGVLLPLAFWIFARVCAEFSLFSYTYPMGLTMVTLGAISVAVDRYRNDAPDREGPLGVIGYLLFFPTMTLGPVLRYKQYLYITERIAPSPAGFSLGARRYMLGFVKRITIAAVLLRALGSLLSHADAESSLPLLALPLLLVMSYALFYSFVSGTTDMARGLMSMYGVLPPRGQAGSLALPTPNRLFYGTLLSLDRYLEDYVGRPIARRVGGYTGRMLCALTILLLTLAFYRMRPELLLFALPLLIVALATASLGRWSRSPRNPVLHALCTLGSVLIVSVLTLALCVREPLSLFTIFTDSVLGQTPHTFYHLFGAIPDARYLTGAICLVLLVPIARLAPLLARRLPERVRLVLSSLLTAVLFAAFVITVLYFLPQFPQYEQLAFDSFFL